MATTKSIAVGLSGGVDSAVAAALLKREGYRVLGLTMKIWSGAVAIREGAHHACFGPGEAEDIAACEALCSQLGIDYHVVDLTAEYEARVLDYFRSEYLGGRTPNPCIVCNRELKFGFLLERARDAGIEFDLFATGHYARIERRDGLFWLRTALDASKDQSYFLHRLPSDLLGTVRFPLGELHKNEVRAEARRLGLEVADKAESQDFIAGGDYTPLFADAPPSEGDIVDESGRALGRHRGLPYYTVGQRRGLGISVGVDPLYVLRLDAERNHVIVGPGRGLFAEALEASDLFLQDPQLASRPFAALARIRQNHKPAPCRVTAGEGYCRVDFDDAQRAIAPGQSIAFYDDSGFVLGGAIIRSSVERA
ncbi:MAG TPA: tRNA 2-thiouridine(34) synthase MnmA [Rectinemataceae bacterium]|nr:tRNA 2-thiouridine(34) synthase MnmA [Rectinemataceae bacterium]